MKRLDRIALGKGLRAARDKRGMTTRQVGFATGVSAATISRAERAHPDSFQNAESILLLCDYFGVDPFGALESVDVFHGDTPLKQDCEVRT